MEYFRSILTPEPSVVLTTELLISARIPRSLWNCTLSSIPEKFKYGVALREYVKTMHITERSGKCLYLHGPYGRGKSGGAASIAKAAMARGGRVIFFSALELDTVFGKSLDNELRDAVLKTHFLVLDDLGAEKSIPWSPSWIETIIKLRNNDNLITFITSNDRPVDFMGRVKSVASILGGRYEDIYVDGHDWRMDGPPDDNPPESPPDPPKLPDTVVKSASAQIISDDLPEKSTHQDEVSTKVKKEYLNIIPIKDKIGIKAVATAFGVTPPAVYRWMHTGVSIEKKEQYLKLRREVLGDDE